MNTIFDNKQEFTELYRDAVMSISGKICSRFVSISPRWCIRDSLVRLPRMRWRQLNGICMLTCFV